MIKLRTPSRLPRRQRRRAAAAFTLVELMISIALVLLLIYGISQVFKLSSDTIGANTAIANAARDHRAASQAMAEDWRNSLPDSPITLISSRVGYGLDSSTGKYFIAGWKNADEQRNAKDTNQQDPLLQTTSDLPVHLIQGTDRTPRIDRLAFFARNLYHRQTAAAGEAAGVTTSA
ncbi:MAG TPA: type II secretion system protein, partial [Tepidisphaeraceae bacterium]